MRLRFGTLIFFMIPAAAQDLSVGIIGGGSLTNAFPTHEEQIPHYIDRYSETRDWLLGASLEYRFNNNWSVEADGMYRKLHLTVAFVEPDLTLNSVSPSPVITWEFPVPAKYRLHWPHVAPFLEGGPSFRTTGNLNAYPSHAGGTVGVGVATHWRGFEISPVVRYTRWAASDTKEDQVELLLEISRQSRLAAHPLGTRVSVGVVAGLTLTHDFADTVRPYSVIEVILGPGGSYTYQSVDGTAYQHGATSFLIGPSLDIGLTGRLSLELDALYHPLRYSVRTVSENYNYNHGAVTEAATWEFPVLAKYRFGAARWKPFIEAGPSFRLPQQVGADLATYGATAGAGVETHWRWLKIAPELRFTRWGEESPRGGSDIRRNSLVLLTGFRL